MKRAAGGSNVRMAASSGLHRKVDGSAFGVVAVRAGAILFAHDPTQATCAPLLEIVEREAGASDRALSVAGSAQAAAEHLRAARDARGLHLDLAVLCLDLPPAPTACARLATFALDVGVPVVLVTRSMHWLAHAPRLATLPWLRPDAPPALVASTLRAAIADFAPRDLPDDDLSGDRVSVGF